MIQAGDKSYIYNGNNKVIEVRQNGKTIAKFEYNIDGQIAKAIYGDKKEEFIWDGLALIWRSGVTYINEPYVTGGNPVMAGDDVLFNDMLGSTLAVNDKAVEMTSFGETDNENAFFTGKPMIDELGYSFLFRDYNPNQGKWTTSDPLGYPDGWNNLAYCNNGVTSALDLWGCKKKIVGITWNDHWEWRVHLAPGSGLANQTWIKTYDHLWDSLEVTIDYDIVIDNWNLVNIVVKSISSEYTGNASIVGSATIPIPSGGGSSLTLSRNFVIGWDAPTITRNSGVDSLGRAWNDETMILHLKVYDVSAFTATPPVLDNYSKKLEFTGEVTAAKDVTLYGKAVE